VNVYLFDVYWLVYQVLQQLPELNVFVLHYRYVLAKDKEFPLKEFFLAKKNKLEMRVEI
jgi:hypothetical protein